jgi:ABC-type multidrug transport system permease subunit
MAMAATAATVVAAGCQQHGLETRHVSSCWYVFFLFSCFLFFYYTNFYSRSTQHV